MKRFLRSNLRSSLPTLVGAACLGARLLIAADSGWSADDRARTLREAARLIEAHDLAGAKKLLETAIDRAPNDGIALNLLGVIYQQQGDSEEAKKLFERSIEINPRIVGPRINLAALLGARQPLMAMDQIRVVLSQMPGNEQARALLIRIASEASQSALRSRDDDAALSILSKAVEILPGDSDLLFRYGVTALNANAVDVAESALRRALEVDRDRPETHYALGRVYLKKNMPEQAEGELKEYLKLRPGDATAHYGLGFVLMAEQKPAAARVEFERSLQLQPDQTESLFQLGEVALESGDTAAAANDYRKVLQRNPNHAGALTSLGVIAYRSAQYAEAEQYLDHAASSAPSYQKAHYYRALTLSKLSRKGEAQREFELAKKLQPPHGFEGTLDSRPQ